MFAKQDKYAQSINQEQSTVDERLLEDDFNIKEVDMVAPTNETFLITYFTWIGGVSYIAWSAVLNSLDYFKALYPHGDVSFYFPLAPYTAQLIMTFLITFISNAISYKMRLFGGMLMIMGLLSTIPFVSLMFRGPGIGVMITWGMLLLLGFFNNLVYASVAGFASQVSGKFTAYFLMGVAIFGLVQNVSKEVMIYIFGDTEDDDIVPVIAYFIVTNLVIVTGMILHAFFVRTRMYKDVTEELPKSFNNLPEESQVTLLRASKPVQSGQRKSFKSMIECLRYTWEYLLIMMIAVIQMNMVHPGVMLKKPIHGLKDQTKTVSMITTFSVFYIVGKYLGQFRKHYNKKTVYVALALRFVMFAFFIIQAVTEQIPILNTALFGYLNVAAFAVTMGFLNVALFIMGPEQVSAEKKETAGFLSVFSISIGAMIGGLMALTLKDIGFTNGSSAAGE